MGNMPACRHLMKGSSTAASLTNAKIPSAPKNTLPSPNHLSSNFESYSDSSSPGTALHPQCPFCCVPWHDQLLFCTPDTAANTCCFSRLLVGLHGTAAAAKSGHQPTAASVAAMQMQLTKASATVAAPGRDAAAAEGKLLM